MRAHSGGSHDTPMVTSVCDMHEGLAIHTLGLRSFATFSLQLLGECSRNVMMMRERERDDESMADAGSCGVKRFRTADNCNTHKHTVTRVST